MQLCIRKIWFLGLIGIVCLILNGCQQRKVERKPIRVTAWGGPKEIGAMTNTLENFKKLHPDIKVKLEGMSITGYGEKILTQIAGRSGPDIIFMGGTSFFYKLYSKGTLLDLMPFVKEDKEFKINRYFVESIDRFTFNNGLYAIPLDIGPLACIYYNKALFDTDGVPYPTDDWDWNDFLDKTQKLTLIDKDGRVKQYGFGTAWLWTNFIYSNGGRIVDDEKNPRKCTLDEPAAKEGLQFFVDLIHKYKVMPTMWIEGELGMDWIQMFASGRVAMFNSGISWASAFRDIKTFDWDIAIFPKGPKDTKGWQTDCASYGILRTTKYPEECWEIIKCITGDIGQSERAKIGLAMPAIRELAELFVQDPGKPNNKKILIDAIKYSRFMPLHLRWDEVELTVMSAPLEMAIGKGTKSVDEAIEEIVPNVDKILRE